ncbi:MAG: hypothetical protein ACI4F3_08170 [Enterocloster sp.]
MKEKAAGIIRIITAPPVFAFVTLSILYYKLGLIFGTPMDFLVSEVCLSVIPACAYPIAQMKSCYSDSRRECQRKTAFTMSLCGYLAAFIYGMLRMIPKILMWILTSYFLASVVLMIINRGFQIKASGHACSCVLSYLMLCFFGRGRVRIICLILYLTEFWASVYLNRHTVSEFLSGSAAAAAVFCFTKLYFGFY